MMNNKVKDAKGGCVCAQPLKCHVETCSNDFPINTSKLTEYVGGGAGA